jgi:hypothetical protein
MQDSSASLVLSSNYAAFADVGVARQGDIMPAPVLINVTKTFIKPPLIRSNARANLFMKSKSF